MPISAKPDSPGPAPAGPGEADPDGRGHRPVVPPDVDAGGSDDADGGSDDAGPADGADTAVGAPARRFGTVVLAVAVTIGLLLGFAAGWLVPRLTQPGDSSIEAGFARDMTAHHVQAVEMGLIAFQRGTSPAVRQLGVDIAAGQQGEIGTMQTWLREWGLDPTGSQPAMAWMPEGTAGLGANGQMPGMASGAEMTKLREATGAQLDVLFLQLMIRHHLGGIHMVDAALQETDDAEIVGVAQTMKNTQQTELSNLRAELSRLGGSLLPAN